MWHTIYIIAFAWVSVLIAHRWYDIFFCDYNAVETHSLMAFELKLAVSLNTGIKFFKMSFFFIISISKYTFAIDQLELENNLFLFQALPKTILCMR